MLRRADKARGKEAARKGGLKELPRRRRGIRIRQRKWGGISKFGGGGRRDVERVESAYREGVAEAERDIASGRPKLRYGACGAWGEDLARTLQARFGVELVVLSCFTDATARSFEVGYNATVEAHVDGIHGPGSVKAVWDEIQRRRKAAYDVGAVEQSRAAPPGGAADGGGR